MGLPPLREPRLYSLAFIRFLQTTEFLALRWVPAVRLWFTEVVEKRA